MLQEYDCMFEVVASSLERFQYFGYTAGADCFLLQLQSTARAREIKLQAKFSFVCVTGLPRECRMAQNIEVSLLQVVPFNTHYPA